MITIKAVSGLPLNIGLCGENKARQVEFDISHFIKTFGVGTVQLLFQRPDDTSPYPCVVTQKDNSVFWTITNVETAQCGKFGQCELCYFVDDVLVKSEIWQVGVKASMGQPMEEAPEPMESYLEQMVAVGASAIESAGKAAQSEVNAKTSETNAKASEESALMAEASAKNIAAEVKISVDNAKKSEDNSKVSETNAGDSAKDARESADRAAQSERNAKTAETNAAKSAADAEQAKASVASVLDSASKSAKDAANSAEEAKKAITNAGASEQNAKASETNAKTSENNAKLSEQNAAKSAKDAQEAANKAGGVQTVNGKAPDANGNVEIASVGSWNDLTDKPFGEVGVFVEVLPMCQPTEASGGFQLREPATSDVTVGSRCIVNWNGVNYPATVYDDLIGDYGLPTIVNDGGNVETGEGVLFVIQISTEALFSGSPYYGIIQPMDGSAEITLSIKEERPAIKPIDTKYLPNGVPYVIDGTAGILPEFHGTSPNGEFYLSAASVPTVGYTCTVNWNGVEYTCIAQDASAIMPGAVLLGDCTDWGMSGNGEPFVIAITDDSVDGVIAMCISLDGTTDLTISITSEGTTINKLDNRCLDLAWLPTTMYEQGETVYNDDVVISTSGQKNFTTAPFLLTNGEWYIVTWNGVEYLCVCKTEALCSYIGNGTVGWLSAEYGTPEDTGEPFCYEVVGNGSGDMGMPGAIWSGEKNTEVSVKVATSIPRPNKITPEMLPEDATVFHLTSPNGTKFAITVSDDGTLSVTEVSE